MKRRPKLYLEYVKWPAEDRRLWETAFAAGKDVFDDAGPGSRLADRTVVQLQYTYGKFLFFLATNRAELLENSPADRVNATTVEEFVKSQPASCGAITLSIYLYHLWMALKILYPHMEWSWLLGLSNRIKARGRAKPQRHHLVTSETLYALGLELMDEALASGKPASSWRVQTAFRDGLTIALLALVPLRRRTLGALRICRHVVRSGHLWQLDIPAQDTKTKRPLDFPLSPELSRYMDIYLSEIRLAIAGAKTHDFLWASARGRPMNGAVLYKSVCRRTQKAFGFPINLHRFRAAAGTFWSVQDPENVRGVKDLLGHFDFRMTEKHYIMSQSRVAGRALARIVDGLRSGPAGRRVRSLEGRPT